MSFMIAELMSRARGADPTEELAQLRRRLVSAVVRGVEQDLMRAAVGQSPVDDGAPPTSESRSRNRERDIKDIPLMSFLGGMAPNGVFTQNSAAAGLAAGADSSARLHQQQVQELTKINREGVRIKNLADLAPTSRFA